MFFFEKRGDAPGGSLEGRGLLRSGSMVMDRKTWLPACAGRTEMRERHQGAKVFWFFFSKKNIFLPFKRPFSI
jgi:hypothetical protein